MSIQQYSVEVQCDYCDEVIRLSGKRRDDFKCFHPAQ